MFKDKQEEQKTEEVKKAPVVKKSDEEKKKERDEALIDMTETQKKVFLAKEKMSTIKTIEKLEKECAKLDKNLANKREKIEELAEQL